MDVKLRTIAPAARQALGVKLCNPLNIKRATATGASADVDWRGLHPLQSHHVFVRFIEPLYGFRAGSRILFNYGAKHGIATLRGLIERFAPSSENNVDTYVSTVVYLSGITPSEEIDLTDMTTQLRLIKGMTAVEIGRAHPYREAQMIDGILLGSMHRAPDRHMEEVLYGDAAHA